MEIPVYMFTGFLDSGKSTFLQSTLEDKRFNNKERTLVLLCEEGECELDPSRFSGKNVTIQKVDKAEDLTLANLTAWQKDCRAQRVMVEYNGMWAMDDLFRNMPKNWIIYQEMMFADASTFEVYNANMRERVVDKLQGAQLVVFNRSRREDDKMPLHKIVRAINRRTDIAYEYANDEVEYDTIEDPLPFDKDADVIIVEEKDFALWYRDLSEDLESYDGKRVRFVGQVVMDRSIPEHCFVVGRPLMTCCADDIQFAGLVCEWKQTKELTSRDWVQVTADISVRKHACYGRVGPVLEGVDVVKCEAPTEEVASFY